MGLGKTLQTLALLLHEKEAGNPFIIKKVRWAGELPIKIWPYRVSNCREEYVFIPIRQRSRFS